MRRETRNKKVLQAITIGLSAMMAATSMPMNVLAAEAETEPVPAVDPSTTTATNDADDAQAAATAAVTPINTAIDATNTAAEAVDNATLNPTDTKVNPNTGVSYATELDDAANAITGGDGTGDLVSPSGEITATGTVDGISDDLADLEVYDGAADAAVGVAGTQATGLQNDAATLEQATKQAAADMQAGINTINTATTDVEANNAYAALQGIAKTANDDFDKALSDYDKNLAAYNAQLDRIKDLEDAYNKELAAAKKGAGTVQSDLDAAQKKAKELKEAADAALANLDQQTLNMAEIDRLITLNNTDSGTNWQNDDGLRELFKKTMLFHYLPEAGIMTKEEVFALQNQDGFDINKVIESVERNGSSDYTYHKIKVGDKTYYFNYRLKKGTDKTDIIIFEKRGVEILTNEELKKLGFDEFDEYKNEEGKEVDISAGLADGSIAAADKDNNGTNDLYVQLNGEGETVQGKKEGDVISTSEDGKTETRIETIDGVEEVSYAYNESTGEVVKTVKKGATTVVYRQQRVEITADTDKILTEDGASEQVLKEALAAKLAADGVTEYDKVAVDGEITETQEWEATGSYKPVFKDKITITATYDLGLDILKTENDVRKKMEGESAGKIEAALKAEGQTLVGSPVYQVNDHDYEYYWERPIVGYKPISGKPIYGMPERKQRVTADYTTYVDWHSWDLFDGKWCSYWTAERTADYKYTDNNITGSVTGTGTTADLAKANANAQIDNYMQTYGNAVGIQNVSVDAALKGVTYSAWFTYWVKDADAEDGITEVVTSTTKFVDENTSELTGSIVQNKIYWDYMEDGTYHDSLMSINDGKMATKDDGSKVEINKGLQEELEKAKALKKKYSDLQAEAEKAVASYEEALSAVENMQKEIADIDSRNTQLFKFGNLEGLENLSAQQLIAILAPILEEYQEVPSDVVDEGEELEDPTNIIKLINSLRDLYDAANNLIEIDDLLDEAEDALGDTIARLTSPTDEPGAGGTPGAGGPDVTLPTAGVPLAFMAFPGTGAGAAGAGGGTGAVGGLDVEDGAGLTEIGDAEIPAGMTEEEAEEIINDLTDITDKTVPLTDLPDRETVGWWWWLLMLLFGAAAVEAYRRYQNKKKKSAEVIQNDDKK